MSFMESLSKAGASTAAVVVWTLTAFLMLGAVWEARKFVTVRESLAVIMATTPPEIVVTDKPAEEAEYMRVVDMVKQMHPTLRIGYDTNSKGIFTESNDLAAYYEWLISIYDIMTAVPNAKWATVSMCVGDGCTTGAKYRIVMTAQRRDIDLKIVENKK